MRIRKLLVANRSEIAIRIMRAATELGIRTVAVYANEDRFALHRFKSDASYLVGDGRQPVAAYLDIDGILAIAQQAGVDAIHPGYGFLSENPEFAEACAAAGILFIGPRPQVMRTLGNTIAAREVAQQAGVPVMPATGPLPDDVGEIKRLAAHVGYPLMLKASWGGGGRGMRIIESEADLDTNVDVARREALSAFGNDEVYLEKLVRRARHVEVQVLGDVHGTLVHLFERDCSVQRRNQKVVERAPAPYLDGETRAALCESALKLTRAVKYTHAGTIEFLMDVDDGEYYFIEVNPRIQVEHTVTEEVTGIDIVKAQIRITEGARIGTVDSGVPQQSDIVLKGHALQCRVTTEDPENNFTPDYGRLTAYRSASGFGVRLDGGTAYTGAVITPYYDSLLVKVTTWAPTGGEAIKRMDRSLREFRIRGLASNLQFLKNIINHPLFQSGENTTRFIDSTPELFTFVKRRDRATRMLRFLGEVIVNGNPEMEGRLPPGTRLPPLTLPTYDPNAKIERGSRDEFKALGAERFGCWMLEQPRVLLTDTTMRDAHQSLFATRMRTQDMVEIAPYYARMLPQLFSLECWGGATFDVALRFLKEDPWERLARLREAIPNILLQMLLRASNAVGYTNYPDNVVKYFVRQASAGGIDLFRVFDALNSVENMRVAIDAVCESGAICEGAVCYTGDLFDPNRAKYNLKYYVEIAKALEQAGAHVIGIKDMAGVCRPRSAYALVAELKQEIGLPIHFHTHDTSGIGAAGCDAIDGAFDSMSGLTSQPNLGAIAMALAGHERDPAISLDHMQAASHYWEGVRRFYEPFEADIRSGTSDVYRHEMPGGQYTNLREQARAIGLDARWPAIARTYAEVNQMFGDIIKVTPTSKVVGDMALFMVVNDLDPAAVLDSDREIAFPESVVSLFKGELGFPPDGFPRQLQQEVLAGEQPLVGRPGASLPPIDLDTTRTEVEKVIGRSVSDNDLASSLMYPKVFRDYAAHRSHYGDVSRLPTTAFFYGLTEGDEISVDLGSGEGLLIALQGRTEVPEDGEVKLFFELNGQPRVVRIAKAGAEVKPERPKAEVDNADHVGAPMPGMIASVAVTQGQKVKKGDPLLSIEAMKMETQIRADVDATIKQVLVRRGETVDAHDLLVVADRVGP